LGDFKYIREAEPSFIKCPADDATREAKPGELPNVLE